MNRYATLRELRRWRHFDFGRMGCEACCPECNYQLDYDLREDGTARLFCPFASTDDGCNYAGRAATDDDWDVETETEVWVE